MVKAVIKRDGQGNIFAFDISGHAGAAQSGMDIYCAAISAITQTAVVGLQEYANVRVDLQMEDGYLTCMLLNRQDASREDVKTITSTMLLGLKSFQKGNKRYLKLIEEVL